MHVRKLARWAMVVLAIVGTSGCASAIMQSYVGKPMTDPVLDYGQPSGAFDMDPTTRAFVWTMTRGRTVPGYVYRAGGVWGTTAIVQPPTDVMQSCRYALYARRAANGLNGPAGWIVTGYRTPLRACE